MSKNDKKPVEAICEAVENKKGFRVIKVSRMLLEAATRQKKCVCDNCLKSPDVGYYVAVINRWLCPKCYSDFYKNAINYPEDRAVEETSSTMETFLDYLKDELMRETRCKDCAFADLSKAQHSFGTCYEQPGNGFMAVWISQKSHGCEKFKSKNQ